MAIKDKLITGAEYSNLIQHLNSIEIKVSFTLVLLIMVGGAIICILSFLNKMTVAVDELITSINLFIKDFNQINEESKADMKSILAEINKIEEIKKENVYYDENTD